jgi:hypothetical protein
MLEFYLFIYLNCTRRFIKMCNFGLKIQGKANKSGNKVCVDSNISPSKLEYPNETNL